MRKVRVAVNGLGRIGRAFVKLAIKRPEEIQLVAVNDLGDINNLAYLLRYDSAYGRSGLRIITNGNELVIEDQPIKFLQLKDPTQLPWADLKVDVVVESTG